MHERRRYDDTNDEQRAAVFAAGRSYGRSDEHRGSVHEHLDTRFSHNHSYFDRGYSSHEPPRIGYAIDRGRDHFWYDRGQWYRHSGVNWVVVGAPIGAFVSVLPPFYTSVWFGGVPYYYANDTIQRTVVTGAQKR